MSLLSHLYELVFFFFQVSHILSENGNIFPSLGGGDDKILHMFFHVR